MSEIPNQLPSFIVFKDGMWHLNFHWEPPPPPEYRLYYDDNGNVLFYSGEPIESEHKYIVIDAQTLAEARPDLKVIDGKIVR